MQALSSPRGLLCWTGLGLNVSHPHRSVGRCCPCGAQQGSVALPLCFCRGAGSQGLPLIPWLGAPDFPPPRPFVKNGVPKDLPAPSPLGLLKWGHQHPSKDCRGVIVKPTSVTYWVILGKSLHFSKPVSWSPKQSRLYLPLPGRAAAGSQ